MWIVTARAAIVFCAALLSAFCAMAAEEPKPVKSGLVPADWAYELPEGVTRRETTYYSDDVPCFAVLFFPKGFTTTSKTPGIVLGQGWAGVHNSIEKYGA